jgi:hypothetical protein
VTRDDAELAVRALGDFLRNFRRERRPSERLA